MHVWKIYYHEHCLLVSNVRPSIRIRPLSAAYHYGHVILYARSLKRAGFGVPVGTLWLGLHSSVDLGIGTGPLTVAVKLILCSAIHQLVAALSGTTRIAFVLNLSISWTTSPRLRTGVKIQAYSPGCSHALQSDRRAWAPVHPGV